MPSGIGAFFEIKCLKRLMHRLETLSFKEGFIWIRPQEEKESI